jgi:Zn-dependent M28 family amino/carboxypeptidase
VSNRFLPGPIVVHNTVGEIRGSEKPDEFVVVGAHLDSWDLGQGTLDNGAGTVVVLEAARVLARCGARPKRTIRFVLFTGEEQGLHGSRAYVARHKDEMARTSAALVHDTGTGKVIGLGWMGKANLKPLLEPELGALKGLGVQEVHARGMGGSDHVSFARAGVPACMFRQELAGYRFGHHSQADTLEMAREADLVQGAQVMALTALRLANADKLLPRDPLVTSPRRR